MPTVTATIEALLTATDHVAADLPEGEEAPQLRAAMPWLDNIGARRCGLDAAALRDVWRAAKAHAATQGLDTAAVVRAAHWQAAALAENRGRGTLDRNGSSRSFYYAWGMLHALAAAKHAQAARRARHSDAAEAYIDAVLR